MPFSYVLSLPAQGVAGGFPAWEADATVLTTMLYNRHMPLVAGAQ